MTKITVRYQGPRGFRGSRYIATTQGRQLSKPYDYAQGASASALATAVALGRKLGLLDDSDKTKLVEIADPRQNTYVFEVRS